MTYQFDNEDQEEDILQFYKDSEIDYKTVDNKTWPFTAQIVKQLADEGSVYKVFINARPGCTDGLLTNAFASFYGDLNMMDSDCKNFEDFKRKLYIDCCKLRYVSDTIKKNFRATICRFILTMDHCLETKINKINTKEISINQPFEDTSLKYCFWTVVDWMAMFFNLKQENNVFQKSYLVGRQDDVLPKMEQPYVFESDIRYIPVYKANAKSFYNSQYEITSNMIYRCIWFLRRNNIHKKVISCVNWMDTNWEKPVIDLLWVTTSPWRYYDPDSLEVVWESFIVFMLVAYSRISASSRFAPETDLFKQFRVIFWEIVHATAKFLCFYDPEDSAKIVEMKQN